MDDGQWRIAACLQFPNAQPDGSRFGNAGGWGVLVAACSCLLAITSGGQAADLKFSRPTDVQPLSIAWYTAQQA